MKLNLFFIAMYLFTLLAYPFVFMHGKLRQFSKAINLSVTGLVIQSYRADEPSETLNIKKGDYAYAKD